MERILRNIRGTGIKILSITVSFFLMSGSALAQVCSVALSSSTTFDPTPVWVGQYVDPRETTLIGDVDGDGVPEVVADDYRNPGNLYVLDGQTGATEHTINTGRDLTQNNSANGIADMDGDGYGEIYFVDDARFLNRRDFDGTTWSQTWISPAIVGFANNHDRFVPHFADFDGDGTAEIYMGGDIYRASDGVRIASTASGYYPGDLGGSNAMDILPDNYVFVDGPRSGTVCADCGGLEIAMGSRVFTVDLVAGTLTLATEDGTGYDGRGGDAIADMDNDGDVDIIYGQSIGNDAHILVRDGQTSETMMILEVNETSGIMGRPNIADFDGDGCNEIGVVTRARYSVIDDVFSDDGGCPGADTSAGNPTPGGSILRFINNSDTSGVTGSSVFDFDLDGEFEVVYRDQSNLYILAGPDGSEKFKEACSSGTRRENPVIADVNADGQTEIVVACGAGISTFRTADPVNQPWAPSRPVRNQHGYHITNVNDDLTIPSVPVSNPTHAGGVHDSFMTQSLPIDAHFNLLSADLPLGHVKAADATIQITDVDTSQCALSMDIELQISNIGDQSLPLSTPIQIYTENPTLFSTTSIWSGSLGVVLGTGQSSTKYVSLDFCESPLYAVINDGTTSTPYSLSSGTTFPGTGAAASECTYENNMDNVGFEYCGDGNIMVTTGVVLGHPNPGGTTRYYATQTLDAIFATPNFDMYVESIVMNDGTIYPVGSGYGTLDNHMGNNLWGFDYDRLAGIINQFYDQTYLLFDVRTESIPFLSATTYIIDAYTDTLGIDYVNISYEEVGAPCSIDLSGTITCSGMNGTNQFDFQEAGGFTSLEECDDGNADAHDGCSSQCEREYCRDDAPIYDTGKNFTITSLTPTVISGTSAQPSSKVAICFEDAVGSRDIFYTSTDSTGAFTYTPDLTPYATPWVNVGVMLHDQNNLDIDHHALVLMK